jgi:hypothetical protein
MLNPLYYDEFVERICVAMKRHGIVDPIGHLHESVTAKELFAFGVKPVDILAAANSAAFELRMPGEAHFTERPPWLGQWLEASGASVGMTSIREARKRVWPPKC